MIDTTEIAKKGLLIDPENLDPYLKNFKNYEEDMNKNLFDAGKWKDRRVFITGVSGFAGSHLAERLISVDAKVYGLVRRHSVPEYRNISHIINKMKLVEGNLTDIDSILTAFKEIEPEVIFHLGAQSFIVTSFRCPIETYETNMIGTANILEAVRKMDNSIKSVQIACSSEEYGLVYPNEVPIRETNPLRPQSPYAVSKVAGELMGQVHHKAYGTPVKITRTFNHTGPRRGLQFVTSIVCRQIAKALIRGTKEVTIGNPHPIRDFTDVRDICQGYLLAADKAKDAEPYNLGHGMGISIGGLIKLAANVANVKVETKIDKTRFRPAEVEVLICDYSKAKKEFGYRPRIPLTKALLDTIEYFKNNQFLLDIEAH